MFKKNDKSFNMIVKITNVVIFVLMCVSVIAGIVMTAAAFRSDKYGDLFINFGMLFGGLATIVLAPILLQLVWLAFDMAFNFALDVKLIRNAGCGQAGLQELPAPLFRKTSKKQEEGKYEIYKKLKEYKELLDEAVITEDEYAQIKAEFIVSDEKKTDSAIISQVKELKKLVDENIITEQEFSNEKNKILKK